MAGFLKHTDLTLKYRVEVPYISNPLLTMAQTSREIARRLGRERGREGSREGGRERGRDG